MRNNVVARPRSTGNCLVCVEDYTHQRTAEQIGVTMNGNVYNRLTTPTWTQVWSRGAGNPAVYTSVAAFAAATGQDAKRVSVDGRSAVSDNGTLDASIVTQAASIASALPSDVSSRDEPAPRQPARGRMARGDVGDLPASTTTTHGHRDADGHPDPDSATPTPTPTPPPTVTPTPTQTPAPSAAIVDEFSRTLASGFGSMPTGQRYTMMGSATSSRVSGGRGYLVMAKAASGPASYVEGATSTNTDLSTSFGLSKAPVGGTAGVDQSVVVRRVPGVGDYRAKVRIMPNGTVTLGLARTSASGVQTMIAAGKTLALKYTAPSLLWVRVQAVGTGTTALHAKVWAAGTSEPAAWQVDGVDKTPALQRAGGFGMHSYLGGGTTNAPVSVLFDSLRVSQTP